MIATFRVARREFEKKYVEDVLVACAGNVSKAAIMAGKDRSDFYDLLRRAGVDPQPIRRFFNDARRKVIL